MAVLILVTELHSTFEHKFLINWYDISEIFNILYSVSGPTANINK